MGPSLGTFYILHSLTLRYNFILQTIVATLSHPYERIFGLYMYIIYQIVSIYASVT
jgi:hypothetical protein